MLVQPASNLNATDALNPRLLAYEGAANIFDGL